MADQPLFPEPAAERATPLGHTEPDVHFLTDSTTDLAKLARANVNAWYEEMREHDEHDSVAIRLRSENDIAHKQALDELFVHHLLRQNQTREIRYEEGEGKRPDFRTYRHGELEATVEVMSLFGLDEWEKEKAAHGRLADELNTRLTTRRYAVDFDIERLARTPSIRRLAEWVDHTIDGLPPPDEMLGRQQEETEELNARYEEDGVCLDFYFTPLSEEDPAVGNADQRIVGSGPVIGGEITSDRRLRKRLDTKAGKYGQQDASYVIAVGNHDSFASPDIVEDALHGSERITGPDVNNLEVRRPGDGFYGVDRQRGGPRRRGVSAVVVLNNFQAWAPENAELVAYDNPYAEHPLPDDLLPLNRRQRAVPDTNGKIRMVWDHGLE